MPLNKWTVLLTMSLILVCVNTATSASAQSSEQAADQSAFQDDDELLRMNSAQIRSLESQEMSAEQQASFDDKRNQAYRLYAEKRIEDLEKLKSGKAENDKQIAILQRWLKADSAMRLADQQTINNLRKRIYSMQQSQQTVMANLGGDVGAMREAANDARADDKFKQQMAINYFNELQSEMGPATWVHPNHGATYGMGGYGFSGGQALFGGGY